MFIFYDKSQSIYPNKVNSPPIRQFPSFSRAHRCRKTSRFTSGENLCSRSPSERYFHKLEYAHMLRTHLWPRPYAPLSNNWQGPIHSRSTMISFPRPCLIRPCCLSDNCNAASGKKIGSSLQFMCDHLSYATSLRIQSRNAPGGEERRETTETTVFAG